jgi:hypothetical protein
MGMSDLTAICAIALIFVFALLAFLAGVMVLITALFPERGRELDPVIVAAISGAVGITIPGARVSHIEEEK